MKKIIFILIILTLTACSSQKSQNLNIEKIERRPNDLSMQKCEDLTALNDNTFKSVIIKLQEVTDLYKICETKRKSLENFINNEVK